MRSSLGLMMAKSPNQVILRSEETVWSLSHAIRNLRANAVLGMK
jgi:hypothetical protein